MSVFRGWSHATTWVCVCVSERGCVCEELCVCVCVLLHEDTNRCKDTMWHRTVRNLRIWIAVRTVTAPLSVMNWVIFFFFVMLLEWIQGCCGVLCCRSAATLRGAAPCTSAEAAALYVFLTHYPKNAVALVCDGSLGTYLSICCGHTTVGAHALQNGEQFLKSGCLPVLAHCHARTGLCG